MKCSIKTGLSHHVSVRTKDGFQKIEVGPFCNEILDSSEGWFNVGFDTVPIPSLGSSNSPVNTADISGVLQPLPTSRKVVLEQPILINSENLENGNLYQWRQSFEYTYSGNGAFLREVGINNFSRALITDIDDNPTEIELKSGDIVTLVTVFSMLLENSSGVMTIDNPYIENPPQTDVQFTTFGASGVLDDRWYLLFRNVSVRAIAPTGFVNGSMSKGQQSRQLILDALIVSNDIEEVSQLIISNQLSNNFLTINFDQPVEFIATQQPKFRVLINW